MQTELETSLIAPKRIDFGAIDTWINSRLQYLIERVKSSMDNYRLDHAAQSIYDFIWNDYCDWYLELAKVALGDSGSKEESKAVTRYNLVTVLEAALRVAHPIIPYITEEIWQMLVPVLKLEGKSIMQQKYPEAEAGKTDVVAIEKIEWLQEFILGVRKIRGEMNIAPGKILPVILQDTDTKAKQFLDELKPYLLKLGRIESIKILSVDVAPEAAIALVGRTKILIPLQGLIDKDAELARISKELGKIEREVDRISSKLANDNFVSKAPSKVIAKERSKLAYFEANFTRLKEQEQSLQNLD